MQVILLIIQIIISLVIIGLLAGCLYIVVLMVGQSCDGFSMKVFFLNCWLGVKSFFKLALGITVVIMLIWICKFILQPPVINKTVKTDNGIVWLSDTAMVCEYTDSTRYYTVRGDYQEKPGRLKRCIKCGRQYFLHSQWLDEKE